MSANQMVSPAVSELRQQRFDALYAEQHAAVFGYVLRRAASFNAAADAIAATFLSAWNKLDEAGRGPQCRLWLYGVAHQALADQQHGVRPLGRDGHRRSQLTSQLAHELARCPAAGNDTPRAAPSEDLAQLQSAFRSLRERDREPLELEAWERLDVAAIATVLGCWQGTARQRLHRARWHLEAAITADRRLVAEMNGHGAAEPAKSQAGAGVNPQDQRPMTFTPTSDWLELLEPIGDAGAADLLSPDGHAKLFESILAMPSRDSLHAWRSRLRLARRHATDAARR
jgi:RNA polymerase sigma-70 factor (ECF subfamily)